MDNEELKSQIAQAVSLLETLEDAAEEYLAITHNDTARSGIKAALVALRSWYGSIAISELLDG